MLCIWSARQVDGATRRQYYAAAAMVYPQARSIGARTAFCRVRPGLRTGSQPDATSRGTRHEAARLWKSPLSDISQAGGVCGSGQASGVAVHCSYDYE